MRERYLTKEIDDDDDDNNNNNIIIIIIIFVGLRAQIIYWVLDFSRERKKSEDERMVMNGSDSRLNEQDTKGKVVQGGISPWIG